MTDRVGQQIGNYRLTRLLGNGGFGEVYQANHQLLRRDQAIKILLESHFSNPTFRERFIREAQMLAQLDHPNIVHVDELGIDGNLIYLVMPYISGGTLHDILRKRAPLAVDEVSRFLEDMCAGLGYAHQRGVVHMDLKPANLLVHESGRLLLSDFGLAHLIKEGAIEGGVSLAFGTPFYMAPEHLHGQPDPRSDLYALGVILYQMLVGRHPFDGSTPEAVIFKHLTEPPPQVRASRPELPAALESVLGRALAKKPAQRYQTAGELLAEAKAALASEHPTVYDIPSTGQVPPVGQAPTPPVAPAIIFPRIPPPAQTRVAQTPQPAPPPPPPNQPTITQGQIIRVRGPVAPAQPRPQTQQTSPLRPPQQPQARRPPPIQPPRLPGTLLCAWRGHAGPVHAVAWAPDGRRVASTSREQTAQVWDGLTGAPLYAYQHASVVEAVAWAPDGKLLAAGCADSMVYVWNESTGGCVFTYRSQSGFRGHMQGVAWAPDGRHIAAWGSEKTVEVWEALTGANVFVYRGHSDTIGAVAWAPDAQRLVSGSDDGTARIWYPAPVDTLLIYAGHTRAVRAVAWSPDGRRIVSASQDKTVRIWDATNGNTYLIYRGHDSKVNAVSWSPDSRRVASAGADGMVQVWDAATGGSGYLYRGHAQEVYSLAWSPDGTRIASASKDKTVQVWQAG